MNFQSKLTQETGGLSRRDFFRQVAWAGSAEAVGNALPMLGDKPKRQPAMPANLRGYARLYRQNPRKASLQWFRDARFGTLVSYYLASLDGRNPFEQWAFKIPVRQYEKKMQLFTAKKFDADSIADLAVEAGMKYITFVTKHCEGFCLWDTKLTNFNSVKSAAHRDLVAEMVKACNQRGLGFFAFYEYGFDWHHPDGPRRKDFNNRLVEVPYPTPDATYAYGKNYDLNKYLDYASDQIAELLTNYGPIAGIWLDGTGVWRSARTPSIFRNCQLHCQELYDRIHALQPQALVSNKYGVTGTEDFLAPEAGQLRHIKLGQETKPVEVCVPLNKSWSYIRGEPHHDADWVWRGLAFAREYNMNYLLGVGPVPDGSIYPEDVRTLKEVGHRLRTRGWPKGSSILPSP